MTADHGEISTVTVQGDRRITSFGRFMRRFKLDEFPQLWKVLIGEMSLVGPRPDIPGYEEALLAQQADPVRFNDLVIFPDKVRINLEYLDFCSFWTDVRGLRKTLALSFTRRG